MRIGIIGAAGTGKTSLAKNLSAHLDSAYVPDLVLTVLRELGRDSWRGVSDVKQRRKVREDGLRRKVSAEKEHESFVSDKTAVDYLAYWLQNQSEHEDAPTNNRFLNDCKAAALRYDILVYLPYREVVDFGVGRNQDPIHNLKVAAQKRGLVTLLKLPVIDVEYTFGEDVGEWYLRNLAHLEPPAP